MRTTSVYKPLTYNEIMSPILAYKEFYDKAEAEGDALVSSAERLKRYVSGLSDTSGNKLVYNKYNSDLGEAINEFNNGPTIANRNKMRDLRRRYISQIKPMEEGVARIKEIADEQRKLKASNPDAMFDLDFSNEVSLDDIMGNPNLSYNTIRGNDLYTKGAAITKALASRIQQIRPDLGGQYYKIATGFSPELANAFLMQNMDSIPELKTALEGVLSSSGVTRKNWNRAMQYAKDGAASAMVQDIKYEANKGYMQPGSLTDRQKLGIDPLERGGNRYYNPGNGTVEVRDEDGTVSSSITVNKKRAATKPEVERLIDSPDYPGYKRDPLSKSGLGLFKPIPQSDGTTVWAKLTEDEEKSLKIADDEGYYAGFTFAAQGAAKGRHGFHTLVEGQGDANIDDLRIIYEDGKPLIRTGSKEPISDKALATIQNRINEYNSDVKNNGKRAITMKDIVVYKDYDRIGDNHYIITTKYNPEYKLFKDRFPDEYKKAREGVTLKEGMDAEREINSTVEKINSPNSTTSKDTIAEIESNVEALAASGFVSEERKEEIKKQVKNSSNPEEQKKVLKDIKNMMKEATTSWEMKDDDVDSFGW